MTGLTARSRGATASSARPASTSALPSPDSVEGDDLSAVVRGEKAMADNPALLSCPSPFGQWHRGVGGREYRGLRTVRHTYVRSLEGPWLLYDNEADPYQLNNLVNHPDYANLQADLETQLQGKLDANEDEFLPGMAYIRRWGYEVDETGTVPFIW